MRAMLTFLLFLSLPGVVITPARWTLGELTLKEMLIHEALWIGWNVALIAVVAYLFKKERERIRASYPSRPGGRP